MYQHRYQQSSSQLANKSNPTNARFSNNSNLAFVDNQTNHSQHQIQQQQQSLSHQPQYHHQQQPQHLTAQANRANHHQFSYQQRAPIANHHHYSHHQEERQDVIFRKVRGILNKITPETFDKLSKDLINVGLNSPKTLRGLIYLLFDKALKDLKYSSLYAKLCQELSEKAPNFETEPGPNTFCKFLISKCEDEFERRRKATEDFDNKKELTDEEFELRAIAKQKMLGNIKFICELGKKRLLQEEILHECIRGLLSKKKERPVQDQAQDLECLCQIMRTIGSLLDIQASRNLMNQYFERIDMFSKKPEFPSRIRFMLRDVIDLRNNNWRLRPFQREDNAPQPLSKLREGTGYDPSARNNPNITDKSSGNNSKNNSALGDSARVNFNKMSMLLNDDEPGFTTSTDFHWGPSFLPHEDPFEVFSSSNTSTSNNISSSANESSKVSSNNTKFRTGFGGEHDFHSNNNNSLKSPPKSIDGNHPNLTGTKFLQSNHLNSSAFHQPQTGLNQQPSSQRRNPFPKEQGSNLNQASSSIPALSVGHLDAKKHPSHDLISAEESSHLSSAGRYPRDHPQQPRFVDRDFGNFNQDNRPRNQRNDYRPFARNAQNVRNDDISARKGLYDDSKRNRNDDDVGRPNLIQRRNSREQHINQQNPPPYSVRDPFRRSQSPPHQLIDPSSRHQAPSQPYSDVTHVHQPTHGVQLNQRNQSSYPQPHSRVRDQLPYHEQRNFRNPLGGDEHMHRRPFEDRKLQSDIGPGNLDEPLQDRPNRFPRDTMIDTLDPVTVGHPQRPIAKLRQHPISPSMDPYTNEQVLDRQINSKNSAPQEKIQPLTLNKNQFDQLHIRPDQDNCSAGVTRDSRNIVSSRDEHRDSRRFPIRQESLNEPDHQRNNRLPNNRNPRNERPAVFNGHRDQRYNFDRSSHSNSDLVDNWRSSDNQTNSVTHQAPPKPSANNTQHQVPAQPQPVVQTQLPKTSIHPRQPLPANHQLADSRSPGDNHKYRSAQDHIHNEPKTQAQNPQHSERQSYRERGWRRGPSVTGANNNNGQAAHPAHIKEISAGYPLIPKGPTRITDSDFSLRPSHNLLGRINPSVSSPRPQDSNSGAATVNKDREQNEQVQPEKDRNNIAPSKNQLSYQEAELKQTAPVKENSARLSEHKVVVEKFVGHLRDFLDNDSPSPSMTGFVSTIKELKLPKACHEDCIKEAIKLSLLRSDNDRDIVMKLFVILIPAHFEAGFLLEAFKQLFEQLHTLEVETPRVKSLIAGFLSYSVRSNIITLEDVGNLLFNGKHHPLFLLVIQKLEKSAGQVWVNEKFIASKINLMDMLPETDRSKDRLASILKDRCLGFLDPTLTIEPDLWQQFVTPDSNPASIYRWIKENVDANLQKTPTFAHVFITCLLRYIHESSSEKSKTSSSQAQVNADEASQDDAEDVSENSSPNNAELSNSHQIERDLLTKFQQILLTILKDKRLQLTALYSLQSFYHGLNFPKGSLLRWFDMLYDLNIVDDDVFFTWKEEINDSFPGKGQALFQVNNWLNWLAEPDSEEDDGEEDD